MSNEVRKVTKVKAAIEDLLIGEGRTEQLRNGQLVEVTRIQLKWFLESIAALKATDPGIFKHVGVKYGSQTLEYTFDDTSNENPDDLNYIAPDVGSGRWVLLNAPLAAIGQLCMMKNVSADTIEPFETVDVADLEFAGIYESAENPPTIFPADVAANSTWRCQGYAPVNAVTLFMRVS